ncbi:hypothetical protein BS50DRAFT_574720 [Corynespora cassiicola Philippines]|uniref:NAD(P)-binding protein n=1 Tax=Corynespora cassiicola Philippines TaxID=1448308 RepID=A0A2T2NLE7_CORCC|nr:hypothetical protein BS50DRAFT_574720 [Corynespora cassiicola Philippines]
MLRQRPSSVDILILGAGWTSTFLIPKLDAHGITHAETTTDGRDGTIPFRFNPQSGDVEPYKQLPRARTVLITFPLKGRGQSKLISSLYRAAHGQENNWIQLGSTGMFNKETGWNTEESKYDHEDDRAIAEDELRDTVGGCVLNLSGLYGGSRQPKNWLNRVVRTKEDLKLKGAVHFIHGEDVAEAIIATHRNFTPAKRWIIADLRVYDWWDLIASLSSVPNKDESDEEKTKRLQYTKWVAELMLEQGVRALPRDIESLGRRLDSRGFWKAMGVQPLHPRLA